jgi:DNA-binding GntR family transcriptional regulator
MVRRESSVQDFAETPARSPVERYPKAKQHKGWRHSDAVNKLRDLILSGNLTPGERLREMAISERFSMSRTPVREAFRTLAAEGLVELLPNCSVVVAELDENESMNAFSVLGSLEALAGQQACQRMTPEQLQRLGDLQLELEKHFQASDRAAYTLTNRAIHELMVEASNNSLLILAWRMVLPRAERARLLNNLDRERWAAAVDAHRKIFEALARRDGLALSSLMQDHFAKGVLERIMNGSTRLRVKAGSSNQG